MIGTDLYKIDSKGKTRTWRIDVVDKGTHTSIVTTAGLQDGKKVQTVVDITEGKNIGKSNETTYLTQAIAEAEATAALKLRGEYRLSLDDVEQQTLGSGIKAPMLAQKHSPDGAQSGSKTLAKMGIEGKPIYVQPKLDGNRCLIKITKNKTNTYVGMYTRKGDLMPVQLLHISNAIAESVDLLKPREGDMIILDGELFSDEMSFNALNGHLKRRDSQDPGELAKIKYHLYDIMLDVGYEKRYEILKIFVSDHVYLIDNHPIEATDDNINEKLEEFLGLGFEGLMIRQLGVPYENKRSWQLVKVKVFQDEEYELSDIEEDARGGFVGAFVMKLDPPSVDRDGNTITEFRAGVSGLTQEEGKEMLDNKSDYIGKMGTVEFFGKSEYLVPRFPKFKGIRE